ncbi:hypothetical protein D3C72_530760 [compost metagenome]
MRKSFWVYAFLVFMFDEVRFTNTNMIFAYSFPRNVSLLEMKFESYAPAEQNICEKFKSHYQKAPDFSEALILLILEFI